MGIRPQIYYFIVWDFLEISDIQICPVQKVTIAGDNDREAG